MFFHILKRDIKRKKTMNIILLLFIIVAGMFVSSSIPNIVNVLNGTNYFFDKAGVGDYIMIGNGEKFDSEVEEVLKNKDIYNDYKKETAIFIPTKILKIDGKFVKKKMQEYLIQCPDNMDFKLFTKDNEEIKEIKSDEIMLSKNCVDENNLEIGDKVTLSFGDIEMELTYSGYIKDALFGSDMMGNERLLISKENYDIFEKQCSKFKGSIYNLHIDNESDFKSAISDVDGMVFDGSRSMIKKSYMMDIIVAAIVLLVGLMFVIVSFFMLKFMMRFSISEDFREIGVMKAIGIKNRKIRRLYTVKYVAFAIVGSLIGLGLSVPCGKLITKPVTDEMYLGNDIGFILNVLGTILVVAVVYAYSYHCTKIIKKSSPIDAIRNGQTGERYKKKRGYRMNKSHASLSGYLSLNDILSAPKKFTTVIITFTLCCLITMIISNTTATMKSDKLVHLFAVRDCDLYFSQDDYISDMYAGKINFKEISEGLSEEIDKMGYPNEVFFQKDYTYKLSCNGKEFKIRCTQGENTKASDYEYSGGSAPESANEIAITKTVSKLINAKIGDTVTIITALGEKDCIVTGYFDSMNNLGSIIRLHEDFECDEVNFNGTNRFQVKFDKEYSDDELDEIIKKFKNELGCDVVQRPAEYSAETIGVADIMETLEFFLVLITIVVVIFTSVLMESSFIDSEKSQIAMLKAVGISNKTIVAWQIKRFGVVSLASTLLALVLSVPMTKLTMTPIFKGMGAGKIDYTFNFLRAFLIYPVAIFAVTVITTYFTVLKTKLIKPNDTANNE